MSEIKNVPASVSERLKNIAKESEKAFDTLLLLYFQERFLYRLSISDCEIAHKALKNLFVKECL
jgi:hypothetical protein